MSVHWKIHGQIITYSNEPYGSSTMIGIYGLQTYLDWIERHRLIGSQMGEFPCFHCGKESLASKKEQSRHHKLFIVSRCYKCRETTLWDLSAPIAICIQRKVVTLHFYCVHRL